MGAIFRLNNQRVYVEAGTPVVETQDETLDQATFVLQFNNIKHAILPMTPFQIEDDETHEKLNFVVVNDIVEIVRKIPPYLYKHTITVAQNTRELSKHILRNSNFSQPYINNLGIKCKTYGAFVLGYSGTPSTPLIWNDDKCYLSSDSGGSYAEHTNLFQTTTKTIAKRLKFKDIYLKVNTLVISFLQNNGGTDVGNMSFDDSQTPEVNTYKEIVVVLKKDNLTREITLTNGKRMVSLYDELGESDFNLFFTNRDDDSEYSLSIKDYPTFNQPSIIGDSSLWSGVIDGSPSVIAVINVELASTDLYYYSLYDVLDNIQKQTKSYKGDGKVVFTMPSRNSNQGKILDDIIAPNFEFTENTVYEAINQVFAYIDAIATMDEDGVLGFEYFNDNDADRVVNLKVADFTRGLSEERYANRLVSHYQNGKQKTSVYYPAKNRFSHAVGSQYGVLNIDNLVFNVEQQIDYIDKVYFKLFQRPLPDTQMTQNAVFKFYFYYTGTPYMITVEYTVPLGNLLGLDGCIDITSQIMESKEYATLPTGYADLYAPNKNNVFVYNKGDKSINVGGTVKLSNLTTINKISAVVFWAYGVAIGGYPENVGYMWEQAPIRLTNYDLKRGVFVPINSWEIYLCVEYHAINNGRIIIESTTNKYEGEIATSVSNGGTQLYRMGSNMLGLLSRLGNETFNCVLELSSFDSRLRKGTIWVDNDNNKYIANKVKTTFSTDNDKVMVEVEFIKNFNMLSQFTNVDREKRFYEIDNNIVLKGYENYVDYLYMSLKEIANPSNIFLYGVSWNSTFYTTLFENNFISGNNNNKKPDSAELCCYYSVDDFVYGEEDNPINLAEANGITTPALYNYIAIPIHSYGSGNMLCFEMSYNSPINAGDRFAVSGDGTTLLTMPTIYTKADGFVDMINFMITSAERTTATDMNRTTSRHYPLLPSSNYQTILIDIKGDRMGGLPYYKRPNEILHLNYEIAFLPHQNDEIFVGRAFIENNELFNLDQVKENKNIYAHLSTHKHYSINDMKIDVESEGMGILVNVSYEIDTDDNRNAVLTFDLGAALPFDSWAITDEEGNILICANDKRTRLTQLKQYINIYFYGNGTRI